MYHLPAVRGGVPVASPVRDLIGGGGPIYLTAAELAHQLHVDDKTVYPGLSRSPRCPFLA